MPGQDDGTWNPEAAPGEGTWTPDEEARGTWQPPESVATTPAAAPRGQRYRLGAEVARGGLGRIVEAWDAQLDREVAIKQLLRPSPGAEARFDREMHLTARLQHPNIVPVHDGGRLDGAPYLAMRRVHGRSLGEALDAAEGLDGRMRLLPHLIDAANAIAYAHDQRVVHRDLKPDNVLVGDFGETVVIDWGLAKDLDVDITEEGPALSLERPLREQTPMISGRRSSSRSLTRVGSVMGTPRYMAPEQAAGGQVDARSDVYALGAMLYELLAGQAPYEGAQDVLEAVRAGPPEDVAALVAKAPKDLVAVVRRAMARAPADRYADAASFAADLSRFLEGRFVTAYDYSPVERVVRLVRAYPLATALVVVLVLATAGFVVALDEARALAERGREEAERLEAAAVLREDEVRLDHARRVADSDPARAIGLLAGLSDRTPFDGRVRTIFAAAMAAGPAPSIPTAADTTFPVAASGSIVGVVGETGLTVHDGENGTTEEVLLDEGIVAVVGLRDCLLALSRERVFSVSEGAIRPLDGTIDYFAVSRPYGAQSRAAIVAADSVRVVRCDGIGPPMPIPARPNVVASSARSVAVADVDLGIHWFPDGKPPVHATCGSPRWGLLEVGAELWTVGGADDLCIVDAEARVRRVPVPGATWLEFLTPDGRGGAYVAGGGFEVARLGPTGERVDTLRTSSVVTELVAVEDGVLVGLADRVLHWHADGQVTSEAVARPVRRLAPMPGGGFAVATGRQVELHDGAVRRIQVARPGADGAVFPTEGEVFYVEGARGQQWRIRRCGGHWFGGVDDQVLRDGRPWLARRARLVACSEGDEPRLVVHSDEVEIFDPDADAAPLAAVPLPGDTTDVGEGQGGVALLGEQELVVWDGRLRSIEVPPDTRRVGLVGGEVALATSTEVYRFTPDGLVRVSTLRGSATALAVSPTVVAVGAESGAVRLFLEDGRHAELLPHGRWTTVLDASPDGRFLASGGWDQHAALYDLDVFPPAWRKLGPTGDGVQGLAWFDGYLLTAADNGEVVLWPDPWPKEPDALKQAVENAAAALTARRPPDWPDVAPPPIHVVPREAVLGPQ